MFYIPKWQFNSLLWGLLMLTPQCSTFPNDNSTHYCGACSAHPTMFYIPLVIINHNSTHYCGACSCSLQLSNSSMWPTSTVSQVMSIKTTLSDDWLNDRVMLQSLGTSGTVENINNIQMKLTLYISLLWPTSSLLNSYNSVAYMTLLWRFMLLV